jgi:hypothetical protein
MEWASGEVHSLLDLAKSLVVVVSLGDSRSAGLMLRARREDMRASGSATVIGGVWYT